MRAALFDRLAPAGSPLGPRRLRALTAMRCDAQALGGALDALLGAGEAQLFASGREALRALLAATAEAHGRDEVVIPAYTCFSVPAAAVAAGLRVRLVDVDERGAIDADAFARLPLERVAAVIVCNLLGVPERTAEILYRAEDAGALVVDDAAQCLGARTEEGPVGARGHVGLLSFARGKPLSALGGGALWWPAATSGRGRPALAPPAPPRPETRRALLRGVAYDVARSRHVFGWLAALPFLGIGETPFDPGFPRGGIDGASLALAALAAPEVFAGGRARAARALELAREIDAGSAFRAVLADPPEAGIYPRLGLLAPVGGVRDAALRALDDLGAGASAFYPASLDSVVALAPHLVGDTAMPGARALAARVLTLPTHGELRGARRRKVIEALARASGAGAR